MTVIFSITKSLALGFFIFESVCIEIDFFLNRHNYVKDGMNYSVVKINSQENRRASELLQRTA